MASTIVPSQAAPKNQSKIDKPLNNELILINLHLNRPTQLKSIMTGFFSLSNMVFPYLFIGGRATLNPLDYTWEQRGNVVIVHNPIPVQSLKVFLDDLGKKIPPQVHVLLGVEGQGANEQHIVTMHLPPNGDQARVYDSKFSNPERFFSTAPSKNTILGILGAAFHSLNPFASPEQPVDLTHLGSDRVKSATYYAFGTQSFFDEFTCGYHTGSLIEILADFLKQDQDPSPIELLDALRDPITDSAKKLLRQNAPKVPDVSLLSFWKKAWQDTFLTLTDQELRSQYHFGHYFLGWPSDPKGSKIAYFLTLKFITAPLTNLLSLATEFPLNFLSETSSFLKNRILSWAPTNWLTQSIRSVLLLATMGLQGLFKGAYYLIRTMTSPIVSFKEAQKVHPALGYLSALASVCFIGGAIAALAFFAPPIAAALMPSMGPGALSMLSTLAYPFVQLFSLISVSIPAATGAMLSLITGTSLLGALHLLGKETIYPQENQPVKHHEVNIEVPKGGCNVRAYLPPNEGPALEDAWEDLGSSYPSPIQPPKRKAQNTDNGFKHDNISGTIDYTP